MRIICLHLVFYQNMHSKLSLLQTSHQLVSGGRTVLLSYRRRKCLFVERKLLHPDLADNILGQADRPILGFTCLQDLTISRLRHDWVDSRCPRICGSSKRRSWRIQIQVRLRNALRCSCKEAGEHQSSLHTTSMFSGWLRWSLIIMHADKLVVSGLHATIRRGHNPDLCR